MFHVSEKGRTAQTVSNPCIHVGPHNDASSDQIGSPLVRPLKPTFLTPALLHRRKGRPDGGVRKTGLSGPPESAQGFVLLFVNRGTWNVKRVGRRPAAEVPPTFRTHPYPTHPNELGFETAWAVRPSVCGFIGQQVSLLRGLASPVPGRPRHPGNPRPGRPEPHLLED